MATHCSILAWEIPWTEEPESYSPWVPESDTTEHSVDLQCCYFQVYSKVIQLYIYLDLFKYTNT